MELLGYTARLVVTVDDHDYEVEDFLVADPVTGSLEINASGLLDAIAEAELQRMVT